MFLEDKIKNIYSSALSLFKIGNILQAKLMLEDAIKNNYISSELYQLLGIIENQLNNLDKSENYFILAINNLKEPKASYYSNLADILSKKQKYDLAINNLEKALNIDKNYYPAKYNLANIYKNIGNLEKAIEYYLLAIKDKNDDYKPFFNLANCFYQLVDYNNALKYYLKTIELNPKLNNIYYTIGYIYEKLRKYDDSLKYYLKVEENNSLYKDACKRIAISYEETGRLEKAKKYYQKYYNLEKTIGVKLHLDFMCQPIFLSNKEIAIYREKVLNKIPNYINKINLADLDNFLPNIPPFIYQGKINKEIKETYASIFENFVNNDFKDSVTTFNSEIKSKKIKLGFFLSIGQESSFSNLMGDFINNFDKNIFDIFVICISSSGKEILTHFFSKDKIFFIEYNSSFIEIIKGLKILDLDILYHWEVGTTFINYFVPFFKTAKIQCTSLGWPETSGIKQMDYFISNTFMEKAGSDSHYTEKLIKMNNLPLIYKKITIKENFTPEQLGLPNNYNYYTCLQNIKKIHPDFDFILKNILEKDEKALIIFVEDFNELNTLTLKNRFRITIPEFYERILFLERLSYQEYLNLIKYSDIILDTLYTGGGNTSIEAFSIGTPIITLPAEMQRGRFTYALYKILDIQDCIANSIEEYINLALDTVKDKNRRNNISECIKNKNYLLFNAENSIKELEQVFITLVNN
ncbi:MAG: tetratricopeptide repeat protein [Candidatus Sericytochromatia bacterium]